MASTRCPSCPSQIKPKSLDYLSEGAKVNYYRCMDCHHIWTTSKDGRVIHRHVTRQLAKDPPPADQYADMDNASTPRQKYTAIHCRSCGQAVAMIERLGHTRITLFCPQCGYRWSTTNKQRKPDDEY